jgi:hypothetical protein
VPCCAVSRPKTGQELLESLLQDPDAAGQQLGRLLDAVADMQRLERTVARNDEVSKQQGSIIRLHVCGGSFSPDSVCSVPTALTRA